MDVGPNLARRISASASAKAFKAYLDKSVSESFFITPVTEDEIETELTKLNPYKSCGFDNLHPKILSKVAHLIKCPLK